MIACNGVPVVVDAGRPTYTAQTFGPDRYDIWTMQSSWHNVPEIRGAAQAVGNRHAARDVVEAADALADLDYVIAGMALEAGIPHPDVVREVHRANMSKLGADGQPILREDGKILKSDGYTPPDVRGVLFFAEAIHHFGVHQHATEPAIP